jgi:mannosyltransferase
MSTKPRALDFRRMLIPARTGDAVLPRTASIAPALRLSANAWLLIGLTALGVVLRLATISKQSFWLDEALAAGDLHLSFGAMVNAVTSKEPNPGLFFLVAWPWTKLFGTSEAGIRSLSALAGSAVIPIAYLCGRELVSKRAGLLAATFAAISPFMIWYSQEAREYMLLTAFCGASFLFWARCWHAPTRRSWIWWTTFSALAMLTHYFAGFLVIPEALALLYRRRTREVAVSIGVLAVVGLAILPHFLAHASRPAGWIATSPLSLRLKQLPVAFALGYQNTAVSWALLAVAALAAIVIALLVIGAAGAELRGTGMAAAIAGVVLLIPLALALVGHDYFTPRAMIMAWIPLAVVLGAACTTERARAPGVALAVAAIAAFGYGAIRIATDSRYQKPPWRAVASALGKPSGRRAVVAYDGGFAAVPLALYLHGNALATGSASPLTISEIDVVGRRWQTTPSRLPGGLRVLSAQQIGTYLVKRFVLPTEARLTPAQIDARAQELLGPGPPDGAVISEP